MSSHVASDELLLAKLSRPVTPEDVVQRDDLIARLDAGLNRPLTLVSAGAGFGKTTLLASWLNTCDCASAWLFLDPRDRDLRTFLRYVISAIRTITPGACMRTLKLVEAARLPAVDILTTVFSNDLEALIGGAEPNPCRRSVLVLDDFHLAASQPVSEFLAGLMEHPPTTLHFVISTRGDPPFRLSRLRANDQITEIRMRDLRFSAVETAEFMQRELGEILADHLIIGLRDKTEGWAAGLRLMALTLGPSRDNTAHAIIELLDDNRAIMDYLADEVFGKLSAEDQQFLLETAILEQLIGSLCDSVLGPAAPASGSQTKLAALHQANFFTFALDSQPGWYHYHHLFGAFLRAELKRRYDEPRIAALHARASAWYDANGYVDEAIAHALEARDEAATIALVQTHRHTATDHENWVILERWLSLFSRETIDAHPELLLLEDWVFHYQVQPGRITPGLRRAEELMQRNPLPEPLATALQGEIDTLDAYVAFYALDPERGLRSAQRALATLPREYSNARGNAWIWQAAALLLSGQRKAAVDSLHEGLREDREHLNTFGTRVLLALANLYWWTADLKGLAQTGKHLMTIAQERRLPESVLRGYYHQALAHYQQNELALAEQEFAAVMQEPYLAYPIVYVQSGIGLASVYLIQGRDEPAREVIGALTTYALRMNNVGFMIELRAFEAHCNVVQGRRFEAAQWLATQEDRIVRTPLITLRHSAITLAEVLIADGRPESLRRAADLLPRLHEFVSSIYSIRYLIEVLALEALLHDARGESAAALAALGQAVALAQPGGVIRVFADLGPKMAALLHRLSPQEIASEYFQRLLAAFGAPTDAGPDLTQSGLIEPLTDRELEVLMLLSQRLSNKEIAQALYISHLTVKRHTSNIYQKLAVANRREAIAKAAQIGLLASTITSQLPF